MDERGLTLKIVADMLGEVEPQKAPPSESMVKRHVDGECRPGFEYEGRYERITSGRVTPIDWSDLARDVAAQKRAIVAAYRDGEPLADISGRTERSKSFVRNTLKAAGITVAHQKVPRRATPPLPAAASH